MGTPVLPDLSPKLKAWIERFNATDEELYPQAIPNSAAYGFLREQIPLLDIPDEELQEVYYFRWWTFRKHFKRTPAGHIVTEFLPPVGWAGAYNSINCATCHHLREGRWLADPQGWMKEYIRFWLDGPGDEMSYSMWMAASVEDYCDTRGDDAFAAQCLDALVALYRRWEDKALRPCGLFWSDDDRDGMELSISGAGLRPTLNAYMYGDAMAIARMARKARRDELARAFEDKACRLKERIDQLLWDGDFYKTIPCDKRAEIHASRRPMVAPEHDARELIGYIPWCFDLPDEGRESAFAQLMDSEGFAAPFGLTTAERRHYRFMFPHEHECLWNGSSWPFATSQTLTAAARLIRRYPRSAFAKEDYFTLLKQYARAHHRVDAQGRRLPWIDENLDPFTGEWLARGILESRGWDPMTGGRERGKDYNHSTFCDLLLSGLLGIRPDGSGGLTADPIVPDDWNDFRVSGLSYEGRRYTLTFDRTGKKYAKGVSALAEA